MILEACIFDSITLIEVIFDLYALIKVVFASDILTARFKTDTSGLATVFMAIPLECLDTVLGSLLAFESGTH